MLKTANAVVNRRKLSMIVKKDRRQPLRDIAATFNESGPEQCSLRKKIKAFAERNGP